MRGLRISFFLTLAAGLAAGVHPSWEALIAPPVAAPAPQAATPTTPIAAQPAATPVTPAPVETEKVFFTPDALLEGLRAELSERFSAEGDLVLVPLHALQPIEVPAEGWEVRLVEPYPSTLSARLQLRFQLTDGQATLPAQAISLRAELWREAYMARRLVRPDELLHEDFCEVQLVDWLQHRGDLVGTETPFTSLRLKGAWRPGDPLRWAIAEARPLIESGAVVEVVAEEGTLRVTMRGVATESGGKGDLITVRNLQSRKEIQGIVSDENTVLVVF